MSEVLDNFDVSKLDMSRVMFLLTSYEFGAEGRVLIASYGNRYLLAIGVDHEQTGDFVNEVPWTATLHTENELDEVMRRWKSGAATETKREKEMARLWLSRM